MAISRLISDLIDFASTGLGRAMPLTRGPVGLGNQGAISLDHPWCGTNDPTIFWICQAIQWPFTIIGLALSRPLYLYLRIHPATPL